MKHRRLGLRIPADVHDHLRWESFRTRRSINSIVLEAIETRLGGDNVLHQIWKHMATGNRYAVQLEGDDITGAKGPLMATKVQDDDLPRLDYTEDPDLVEWIKAHKLDFQQLEDAKEEMEEE